MSEENTSEQPQDAPATPEQQAPPADESWKAPTSQAELDRIIADRLNRERAKFSDYKQLQDKAKQYDAFEESQKTEQQKLSERAESASRELEAARSEVTRLRIAARHGLSEDDFDLLGSGSEEDIEKRAQKLAAYKQAANPAAVTAAKRPSENLRPGATPTTEATSDDAYPSEWLPTTTRPGNSGA